MTDDQKRVFLHHLEEIQKHAVAAFNMFGEYATEDNAEAHCTEAFQMFQIAEAAEILSDTLDHGFCTVCGELTDEDGDCTDLSCEECPDYDPEIDDAETGG
jgi:hypothetical protein